VVVAVGREKCIVVLLRIVVVVVVCSIVVPHFCMSIVLVVGLLWLWDVQLLL